MVVEPLGQFGVVLDRPATLRPSDAAGREQGIGLGLLRAGHLPRLGRAAQDPGQVRRRGLPRDGGRIGPDAGGLQLVGLAFQHMHPVAVLGEIAMRSATHVARPVGPARPHGAEHPLGMGGILQVVDPVEPGLADPAGQRHGRPEALPVARGLDVVEIAARTGQFGEPRGGEQGDVAAGMGLAQTLHGRQRQHELAERAELDHEDAVERLHLATVINGRAGRHA